MTRPKPDTLHRLLERDLRLLRGELRQIVRRHGGEALWSGVHTLRDLAERRTAGDPDAEPRMIGLIERQELEELEEIIRAIGLFFDLANITEDRHRVRVLDQRQRMGKGKETLAQAADALRQAGLAPDEIGQRLSKLRVEPVLTAHPTEAKRRSVRRALRRVRRDLARIDQAHQSREQRRQRLARMRRDLASLWYTDPVSPRKPHVMEELRRTLFAARTIWRVTPRLMAQLRAAFPEQDRELAAPARVLAFGNWVGGDRDGNPFVTTPVTRLTLQALRGVALRLHRRECRRVRSRLTVSDARGGRPTQLIEQINRARQQWPGLAKRLDRLHPDEWFVQWLAIIDARLQHSGALPDGQLHPLAYRNADELARDADLIAESLARIDHEELLGGALLRWRDRIGCFGLHLLTLDARVNSRQVHDALADLLQHAGHDAKLTSRSRGDAFGTAEHRLRAQPIDTAALQPQTVELLDLFAMLQTLTAAGYREALGPVIVSMTHDAGDILAVRLLIRAAALAHGLTAPPPLPIAPLFETIDDLNNADRILDQLLQDPDYHADLAKLAHQQVCMIGYSDSAKDGGYVRANWSLFQSQRALARCAKRHGVRLTLFHGRGGAIGRGGGPAARAILSLPPESVEGRLRLTEQGEVIAERYDDPAIALRHLEQLFWGTITLGVADAAPTPDHEQAIIDTTAKSSERAYRDLINHPDFMPYLRDCTVLPLIETLRIGSRPSRRTGSVGFEDLRAIPYTFAWNQVRMPINAFFGLGSAYANTDCAERQRLSRLYHTWPWWRAVIDNAELALARCDPGITRRYVSLATRPDQAQAVWARLADEVERSRSAILEIKAETRLLAKTGWLHRTMQVRTPYLDVLNFIQVELLQRQRTAEPGADARQLEHVLRRTVQAIAAGLRNTG